MTEQTIDESKRPIKQKNKKRIVRFIKIIIGIFIAVFIFAAAYFAYIFASSPDVIRNPKMEHYHFRMQIVVDGKAENFGEKNYQEEYSKEQCNANLVEQPIHFHDDKDQLVHIHWRSMTGGMVMKYYGWNFIGGLNNALGYKMNDLSNIQHVTIHGNYLPSIAKDAKFYIYTGDETGYSERSFSDWRDNDFEDFFGKTSNFPKADQVSILNLLLPAAAAHGTANDSDGDDGPTTTTAETERLTRLNNLLGNVVIFVQNDAPTVDAIKAKFNNLVPLTDSTCGG